MRELHLALLAACGSGGTPDAPVTPSTLAHTGTAAGDTEDTASASSSTSTPLTPTAHTAHSTADTGFEVGPSYLPADHTLHTPIGTHITYVVATSGELAVGTLSDEERFMAFLRADASGAVEDLAHTHWWNGFGYSNYPPPGEAAVDRILYLGDITGDGVTDLAFDGRALQTRAGPITQHTAWATDSTEQCTAGTLPADHTPFACGDLDQDGIDELCVAEGVALGPIDDVPYCAPWPNGGDPVVLPLDLLLPLEGSQWRRMVGADTDGDGRNELLVYQSGNDDGTAAIHHLVDLPTATTATLEDLAPAALGWNTHTGLKHLLAADLTGDGRDNVVHVQSDLVRIGADPADLLEQPHALLPVDSTGGGAAVGDFDRDGVHDIALGQPLMQQVLVFLGPFEGTHDGVPDLVLGAENPLDSQMGTLLEAADLDGDSFEDLIVVDDIGGPGLGDGPGPRSGSKIFVYYGATLFP
jgi:hypothetical protein